MIEEGHDTKLSLADKRHILIPNSYGMLLSSYNP